MVQIVGTLRGRNVLSMTSHEQAYEGSISPTHDYILREVYKVGLISMNIATHVIQGQWHRSCRPGNHQTNVCCMLPKSWDSENFLCKVQKTDCFTASSQKPPCLTLCNNAHYYSLNPHEPDPLSKILDLLLKPLINFKNSSLMNIN